MTIDAIGATWHSLQDKFDRAQLADTTVSAWQVAHRPRAVKADATDVLLVAHARAPLAALGRRDVGRAELIWLSPKSASNSRPYSTLPSK